MERLNRWRRGLVGVVLLSVVGLMAAACGSSDGTSPLAGLDTQQLEALGRAAGTVSGGTGSAGIHVTGTGKAQADPDLADVSVSVETFGDTVAQARGEAAQAATAVLESLRSNGLSDDDIATTRFTIQPEYSYREVITAEGGRRSERVLTGYRVTNALLATVREIDDVGTVIDGAAAAGGDATRIDSVIFRVENGAALEAAARELAVRDALAKADVLATESGASRGTLITIAEFGGSQFPIEARVESAAFDGGVSTPIVTGSFEVTVNVQATFAIE